MSKILLNNSHFLLGFNKLEEVLDKASCKPQDNYPPYNIAEDKQGNIIIGVAVAGFGEQDLHITQEGNQLNIVGQKTDENTNDLVYLHKGIATRKFHKHFLLAEGVEPCKSYLDNGILTIHLIKKIEKKEVKIINISHK
ncbi:Hsp20 family protein [Rickettsiales bacterium LUAb2]